MVLVIHLQFASQYYLYLPLYIHRFYPYDAPKLFPRSYINDFVMIFTYQSRGSRYICYERDAKQCCDVTNLDCPYSTPFTLLLLMQHLWRTWIPLVIPSHFIFWKTNFLILAGSRFCQICLAKPALIIFGKIHFLC